MSKINNLTEDSIVKKIYNLLVDNNVNPEEMTNVLFRVAEDIDNYLWERVIVSPPLLYSLKDVVWYNLEHLPNNGEEKGRSTLKYFGIEYPNFMYQNFIYIQKEQVEPLLKELEDIRSKWSNDWYYVNLISKSNEWSGGPDNPSPVIIYDREREKPSKYGYNPYNIYNSGIVNNEGEQINSFIDIVLCEINSKLGSYGKEPLLKSLLERLIETFKKAKQKNKGVFFDIDSYDYT